MKLSRILDVIPGGVALRRLKRWQLSRTSYPDWGRLLDAAAWKRERETASGPRVLIATNVGAFLPGTTMESLLAVALARRGARVEILLCDEALPACLESQIRWHSNPARLDRDGLTSKLCGACYSPARRMYEALDLKIHTLGSLLESSEKEQAATLAERTPVEKIGAWKSEEVPVGEHALAGALRFFARGDLQGQPQGDFVLRQYFRASLLSTHAMRRLLGSGGYDVMLLHHGIYVPQGLAAAVAREAKVRVVTWNTAYRKRCFIFSHDDTYHHTMMSEPVGTWESIDWPAARESKTVEYLDSRRKGTQDWIWFHTRPVEDVKEIERDLGLDFSKPTIGLLTNVVWDAQLHYPANAFPDMVTWIHKTIDYFARRPDLQLVIRVHPAELTGSIKSRQLAVDEMRKRFATLPSNVRLVGPDSNISTYAAMTQCNAVIIYGTKTGVELTSMGIPVIVAGEAWVRNKGITIDARTEAEYWKILDGLPLKGRMEPAQVERARKYAHHFFFRRMIPVEAVDPIGRWPLYRVRDDAFERAAPGKSPGIDTVCRGILEGRPFVFEAE